MSKDITWQVDNDSGKLEKLSYDTIIGRDLLQALKAVINFKYQVIKWNDVNVPLNRTKLSKKEYQFSRCIKETFLSHTKGKAWRNP